MESISTRFSWLSSSLEGRLDLVSPEVIEGWRFQCDCAEFEDAVSIVAQRIVGKAKKLQKICEKHL
jgi:hypothetical protein